MPFPFPDCVHIPPPAGSLHPGKGQYPRASVRADPDPGFLPEEKPQKGPLQQMTPYGDFPYRKAAEKIKHLFLYLPDAYPGSVHELPLLKRL